MNPGDAFPETRALMSKVAALVPNFVSVTADVVSDRIRGGFPVDIVVEQNTPLLSSCKTQPREFIKVRPALECCAKNLFQPMHDAMVLMGATEIIRGQRLSEDYVSPLRDGDVVDGVRYTYPLQDWSQADVDEFLADVGVELPAHYATTEKSLDCMGCTAFLYERGGEMKYLRAKYPEVYNATVATLEAVRADIDDALTATEEALYGRA
jgi:hypothetical protein